MSGELARDYLAAKDDARRLAVVLWEKHFRELAPDWQPLTDLRGIISQIDNMTAAMTRDSDQSPQGRDAQRLDAKHAGAGRNGIARPSSEEPSHD